MHRGVSGKLFSCAVPHVLTLGSASLSLDPDTAQVVHPIVRVADVGALQHTKHVLLHYSIDVTRILLFEMPSTRVPPSVLSSLVMDHRSTLSRTTFPLRRYTPTLATSRYEKE